MVGRKFSKISPLNHSFIECYLYLKNTR